MHILGETLRESWRRYVFQSLVAVLVLMAVLYFLDILTHGAIVAALGASTFIVFAMPNSVTAQPRNLIGGHIMGLIAGSICYFALIYPSLGVTEEFVYILAAALSVGLSIFLMVITNTEHPPAAATALGIVAYGWSWWVVLFVLLFSVMLSLVRYLLRNWLRELLVEEADVMRFVAVGGAMVRGFPTVNKGMRFNELVELFRNSGHHGFPVLDDDGKLWGMVSLADVERTIKGDTADLTVADITSRSLIVAYPDQSIYEVLRRAGARDFGRIPVVDREDRTRLLGVIRRSDIIRAYSLEVAKGG